jgi:hypothetical protein
MFSMMAVLIAIPPAFAGAPLKGVDVKLGKNPGGNCAAKTTDENGSVDFGVWPKGSYTVSVDSVLDQKPLQVTVKGTTDGAVTREIASASAARSAPIAFQVDGTQHIAVAIEQPKGPLDAARVKSHSNSTNN